MQVAGDRVGLGVRGEPAGQRAAEVHGPTVSSSSVSSYGSGPDFTVARVRPALAITCVLAAKSIPVVHGPAGHGSPRASATARDRTHRLRYHSARPSRSRTPCTIPSPMNQ